jgi:hypothetical protein
MYDIAVLAPRQRSARILEKGEPHVVAGQAKERVGFSLPHRAGYGFESPVLHGIDHIPEEYGLAAERLEIIVRQDDLHH